MPQPFEHLLIHTTDAGVRIITLNRPEKLNAVNRGLAQELPVAVREAGEDESVRCVLITGAGRGFCAGLELDPAQIASLREAKSRAERIDDLEWVGRWVLAMRGCPLPVIAAINGPAAGAGFAMSLATDVRIVSEAAVMTPGYARIAASPDAGMTWLLPRIIGSARAMELILTARDIKAEEALRIGLAAAVLPAEGFGDAALAYATRIAQGPTIAYIHSKRLLLQAYDVDLSTQLKAELTLIKQCFATEDSREAIRAFGEKRKPVFQGK
ncbi:MAG TPA: enoyl-CoA hydratase-related protein [Bryobacteraceae bacterium]|jgi:2-(1,2-epoxy-1,2-dihydrophenyl)acetyl-CoA isomerase